MPKQNFNEKLTALLLGGSGITAHAVLELNKDGGDRKFIIDNVEKQKHLRF